jgi:hypothetical protein
VISSAFAHPSYSNASSLYHSRVGKCMIYKNPWASLALINPQFHYLRPSTRSHIIPQDTSAQHSAIVNAKRSSNMKATLFVVLLSIIIQFALAKQVSLRHRVIADQQAPAASVERKLGKRKRIRNRSKQSKGEYDTARAFYESE